MVVRERYHLPPEVVKELRSRPVPWGFGPLSEAIYYRTYSRALASDGSQEQWADTVIRCVEGVMSIRKDWLVNVIGKRWQKRKYDQLARVLARQIYDLKWLPPGRGLWAMGTEYVYERGNHALNNCGFVAVKRRLAPAAYWLMDSLMCGVGVGFSVNGASIKTQPPKGQRQKFAVPDTKEGWAESVEKLIRSYERGTRPIEFDYSKIRRAGEPIRGFGGTSAGSSPLKKLHKRLRGYLEGHVAGELSDTRLIADTMNAIGACVVSGNVRRSAEIALGSPDDDEFLHLKDYGRHPDREEIGWMSNNSVVLSNRDSFHGLPDLAPLISSNGEPGVVNLLNISKYGRTSERMDDDASGINPCGEIPLASQELCCLVEVFPTRCSQRELADVLKGATFYASTVALLKSHSPGTNEVMSRNRRIGVSVSGVADWIDATSVAHVFDTLNRGYDIVREENKKLAREAGVAESIRVTTVKPSGTVSLLAGVSSGVHFPIGGYVLRRMRIAKDSPVAEMLESAGVPAEDDEVSDNTRVLEFPLHYGNGKTRSVKNVSVYEQAAIVAMLQRCWADNAVSNTLTVSPKELDQVDRVLALFAPQVKSMSLLPDTDGGAYPQMPLERITRDEHDRRLSDIRTVDWSALHGSDGLDAAFCTNDSCEI
jgi:ribonucleoside-diphosphate reductase alpha chain